MTSFLIELASVLSMSTNLSTAQIQFILVCVFFVAIVVLAAVIGSVSKNLRLSYTDKVTGTINYNYLQNKVNKIIKKNLQSKYAICYFDIDRFKFFNDIHGYDEGNKVLKLIAQIVTDKLEKNEYAARINADNFVAFLKCDSEDALHDRIKSIFNSIDINSYLDKCDYEFIFSAGVYKISDDDTDFNVMLDRAGIAKNTVKGGYKSEVEFYTEDMRQKKLEEKEIIENMHKALENGEFLVYYQPKYSFTEKKIVGAEALVRWNHPEKGLIPPFKFIPLFEENGFVVNIDYYVFEQVCKKMREWLDNGIEPVCVSINMSKVHFRDENFVPTIQAIAEKYDIPSKYIELELTESAAFENVDVLLGIMNRLQKIGFMLSMDDFGAGYSSLGLLKDLPVDIIKLDCSFLRNSFQTERTKIIVKKIVELAKELHIEVIAEGVETQEHVEFLDEIGCDLAQGYYYAKPMPIDDFEKYLGIDKELKIS